MTVRHKHLKLDQEKLDRARQALGVATEQETVELALDLVLTEKAIVDVHQRLRGVGGFVDAFATQPRSRRSRRPRS